MTESQKFLVNSSADVLHFETGVSFPRKFLKASLPDVPTAVFFAKVYQLTPAELAEVISVVFPSKVTDALLNEAHAHSTTLQDYLVEEYYDDASGEWEYLTGGAEEGPLAAKQEVQAEILPEVWKSIELEIADSIQQVADKLRDVVAHMPGRTGEMLFKSMAVMNQKRPTIGDHRAVIHHQPVKQVLVVFDVSGSMSENTVRTIVDDVVGLAYESNADLAIVSNTCTYWPAGGYNTQVVLDAAEYGGTHYEELRSLFERDWDVVITVADYDSAWSAKNALAQCSGRIGQLFDISLVHRSTYLAECLGQLADNVQPLLISRSNLTGGYHW